NSALQLHLYFLPTSAMDRCGKQFARVDSVFFLNFLRSRPKRCRNACQSLRIRPYSSVANWISPSGTKTRSFTICMSISCDCAARNSTGISRRQQSSKDRWMSQKKDGRISRAMPWEGAHMSREILLTPEWLVTNGRGGYASGTVPGAVTRRYHGLLIAALPGPLGRIVMWSHVSEFLRFSNDDVVSLGAEERAGGQLDLKSADYLTEFRLEDG